MQWLRLGHGEVGSVRFGFVFQELVDFRFLVRFGSVRGKIIRKSVRFRFGSVFHLHYVMGMYFCFF